LQLPQLLKSLASETHEAPHWTRPPVHAGVHMLFWQICPPGHCESLSHPGWQEPPTQWLPVVHAGVQTEGFTHWPDRHTRPVAPHMLPSMRQPEMHAPW
jgi:hypothetical protein